ncbi:MAG TPA: c-type cytochrome [Bryobacteraceae bacterium]|jgi:cytochrome c1
MHSLLKCAAILAAALIAGCGGSERERAASSATGGDPGAGTSAIARYGCGSCHTIPGITGAKALVGPTLAGIRLRTYIAGDLPNNPENLMRWVRRPLSVHPNSAMPDLGVTADDARNIAAFLYSLK